MALLVLQCWFTPVNVAWAIVIRHEDGADAMYQARGNEAQFAPVGRIDDTTAVVTAPPPNTYPPPRTQEHCSGTLIKANRVLTAGHCFAENGGSVPDQPLSNFTYTVGGNTYNIVNFVPEPRWDGNTGNGFDIAVITLSARVPNVTPAQRFTGNNELGLVGTSVGFGLTGQGRFGQANAGESLDDALKRGMDNRIDLVTARLLRSDFDDPLGNAPNPLGAAAPQPLEGIIGGGDSGGGVFIQVGGNWRLAGVHDFGTNTNDPNVPDPEIDGLYGDVQGSARVSAHNRFIDAAIAQRHLGIGPLLPTPTEVFGKEYSDRPDKNAANLFDPEQNLFWTGTGAVADTFDYSGSRPGDRRGRQVDALAHGVDALFNEVVADEVFLVFSTEGDNRILYEIPRIGGGNVWATPPQIKPGA